MGPMKHLISGSVLAGALYVAFKDKKKAAAGLLASVLVDVDHLLEYKDYCTKEQKDWDFKEFSSGRYFDKKKTVKVIFHSWEIAALGWLHFIQLKNRNKDNVFLGIISGYTLHLLLDQIGNNLNGKGYFLLYRWRCGWKQSKLL